jgi:Flp pilus assembly protein TadD
VAALTEAERGELAAHVRALLARSYLNLGILHARGQGFADAAHHLEKARALDPGSGDIQYALGVTRFNAGQLARAAAPLAAAAAERPDDVALARMLALASLDAEDYSRAAELLGDDPSRRSTASLQVAYAVALAHSGRTADAETLVASLRDLHGESAELLVALGRTQAEKGELAAAVTTLERALTLAPEVAEGQTSLGVVYQRQGRLADAETALRAALALRPDDVRAQMHLALVLEARRRPQEAIPLLRQVVEARPDSADVHEQLARVYQKLGRRDEARREQDAARRLRAAGVNGRE